MKSWVEPWDEKGDNMNRVIVLMDSLKERLRWYREDIEKYEDWRGQNPDKSSWAYQGEFRVSVAEIKRLSMIVRQETIRFEKSLKGRWDM